MSIQVSLETGDLFDCLPDSLVTPIDGDGPGAEGRLLHRLEQLTPGGQVVGRVRSSLAAPMALWGARRIDLPPGAPIRVLVVVHTLPHRDIPAVAERFAGVTSATERAVRLCHAESHVRSVAIPLLTGGFRLPPLSALSAMLVGLHATPVVRPLTVIVGAGGRHARHAEDLMGLGQSLGFDVSGSFAMTTPASQSNGDER